MENVLTNPHFMGISITVIAGLILAYFFGIGKEKTDTTSINKGTKFNKITPAQIRKALDNLPPYQKDDIAKNYKGYRIKWSLQLESARKAESGNIRIQASWNNVIFSQSISI